MPPPIQLIVHPFVGNDGSFFLRRRPFDASTRKFCVSNDVKCAIPELFTLCAQTSKKNYVEKVNFFVGYKILESVWKLVQLAVLRNEVGALELEA